MNLYIDIETIPDIKFRGDLIVSPPANMSKPETITAWETGEGKYAGEKEAAIEKEFRKLAFDGGRGKIICLAFAFDNSDVEAYGHPDYSESQILTQFLNVLADRVYETPGRPEPIKWVGHYITGFDLRFIWQRCVINNIRPKVTIPYDAKPWSDNVFDTCSTWKGASSSAGSLDMLCKAFGYEGKNGMDGSKVYDNYLAANHQKIIDYCKHDVELVRQIHKRMTFVPVIQSAKAATPF